MYYIPRGGNRGGADQFSWSDVKTDKDREYYLGHSLKAPVGRWQDGKDLQWFAKDRADGGQTMSDERRAVIQAEKEAMMAALGQKVPANPPREATSSQMSETRALPESLSRIGGKSKKHSKRSHDSKKRKKRRKEKAKKAKKTKSKKSKRRRQHSDSEESSEESSSDSSDSSDSEEEKVKHRRKQHRRDSSDEEDYPRTSRRQEASRDSEQLSHRRGNAEDGWRRREATPKDRNRDRAGQRGRTPPDGHAQRRRDREVHGPSTSSSSSGRQRPGFESARHEKHGRDSSHRHSSRR